MRAAMKSGWTKFWALPWKWKGPILVLFALFVIGISVSEDEDQQKAANTVATKSPVEAAAQEAPRATSTAVPTAPAPTATPVLTLVQQVEKSIIDNQNWVKSGADLTGLVVNYKENEGKVVLSITPKKPRTLPGYLTAGTALAVISGKAIWSTYPDVQAIEIFVLKDAKDTTGMSGQRFASYALFSREQSAKFDWDKLKTQPSDDNKRMYCDADFYDVDFDIWSDLGDKGCMSSFSGGRSHPPGQPGPVYSQLPAVGEPVELSKDGWVITVTGVTKRSQIYSCCDVKNALGIYLVVEMNLSNISNTTQSLCGDRFTIWDDRGRKYPHYLDGTFLVDRLELCAKINAGLTGPARIVFDVPPDATGLIFQSLGGFKVRLGNVSDIP